MPRTTAEVEQGASDLLLCGGVKVEQQRKETNSQKPRMLRCWRWSNSQGYLPSQSPGLLPPAAGTSSRKGETNVCCCLILQTVWGPTKQVLWFPGTNLRPRHSQLQATLIRHLLLQDRASQLLPHSGPEAHCLPIARERVIPALQSVTSPYDSSNPQPSSSPPTPEPLPALPLSTGPLFLLVPPANS
ncbi:hypothetical protein GBAR_LOCUS30665 [Geodia barretti]|uniref:Uncharacterized protein n=1 Tax=Geodia barretti TaxID=519541 RepID=A0AA35TXG6_GEOBA|nr:hypothetical protein GBAR_LOCUS30665 [Geodia barretti]